MIAQQTGGIIVHALTDLVLPPAGLATVLTNVSQTAVARKQSSFHMRAADDHQKLHQMKFCSTLQRAVVIKKTRGM